MFDDLTQDQLLKLHGKLWRAWGKTVSTHGKWSDIAMDMKYAHGLVSAELWFRPHVKN
jgi:hypothetical protein